MSKDSYPLDQYFFFFLILKFYPRQFDGSVYIVPFFRSAQHYISHSVFLNFYMMGNDMKYVYIIINGLWSYDLCSSSSQPTRVSQLDRCVNYRQSADSQRISGRMGRLRARIGRF